MYGNTRANPKKATFENLEKKLRTKCAPIIGHPQICIEQKKVTCGQNSLLEPHIQAPHYLTGATRKMTFKKIVIILSLGTF